MLGVGAAQMFFFDFLLRFRENSKVVTVASELRSRNDFGDIRTLLLAYLSVRKNVLRFYRTKLPGWAS